METYTRCEEYITTPDNLRECIEKNGVAIIMDVFSKEECEELYDDSWAFYEQITREWETPISRDDSDTWRGFYELFPLHSMLVQHHKIGHSSAAWKARQNKRVLYIFSKLWDCKKQDLLVSYDGSSFHLPPEITKKGWNRSTWFHTDQSFTKKGLLTVQSFVTTRKIRKGDATFAFLSGSHNLHASCGETFNIETKDDWHKLTREQEDWYRENGCEEKRLIVPKGAMVFWDSRTIHCGVEPQKGRRKNNVRCVIYLCYVPRSLSTPQNLKKHIDAFEKRRTTTHNPLRTKLFAKVPRTYGKTIQPLAEPDEPEIFPIGRRLIGYD